MSLKRRDFIKLLAGTTAFGTAYRYGLFPGFAKTPGFESAARQLEDVSLRPPEEKWVPSVCRQCAGGCGILVRLYGQRAVKIDGNPLHPVNRGRLCARGQAGLQFLYDPDRIQTPLARAGERGEGRFKPISWDEALSTVREKMIRLRKQGRPEALVLLTGPERGINRNVSERFMEAYGSPNLIRFHRERSEGRIPGIDLMQGSEGGITYDIAEAAYILSFNSAFLEDPWSPVQTYRAYGKFRRGRNELRGKLVHIEPRLSVTGAKADRWVPIHPGSEGVLAMGIAAVLIVERRFDEDFVAERTFGFEDWRDSQGTLHPGFRTLVLQEYPLDKVVKLTGVSRDTIITLAREFAQFRPSLALGNDAGGFGNMGLYNRMAIHALNALAGSFQNPGGVLTHAKIPKMPIPAFQPDPVSIKGRAHPRIDGAGSGEHAMVRDVPANLTKQFLAKQPYPAEILFLHGANPVFESPEPDRLVSALKNIPFLVSFSPVMDETSRFADLILPDSIYLEKWHLDTCHTLTGNPVVNLSRPVLPPVFDTRDTSEVLIKLVRSCGGTLARAFPPGSYDELIRGSVRSLQASGQGEPFGAPLEELWTKLLERSGWKVRTRGRFDKFWADLLTRGGWWDPVYYPYEWKRVFSTPSGRFEFYSLTAQRFLDGLPEIQKDLLLQGVPRALNMDQEDSICLPHGDPGGIQGNQPLFDLEVNPYLIPVLSGLSHTNEPWLQDITGFHVYQSWHTWVEVNPETARQAGVRKGDWVRIESPKGRIKARVRPYEGVGPGVINLPVGLGHKTGGRWTGGIGENILQLVHAEKEPFTGRYRFHRTRARMVKIDG